MAIVFTDSEIDKYSVALAEKIKASGKKYQYVYGIPMGGYPVAVRIAELIGAQVISSRYGWMVDTLIIDDLVDSGKTISAYQGDKAVLFVKNGKTDIVNYYAKELPNEWITFPWEKSAAPEDAVLRLIQYIGEDAGHEGLIETPARVIRAYDKLFEGYKTNLDDVIKTFCSDNYDEMVILKNIEFYSTCEHHFLPFYGIAHIAYIPNGKVIGVSKLARILDAFSRRLQIQERIAENITEYIMKRLEPLGAACVLEAQHLCMTARGVEKQKSKMITSSLKGIFKEDVKARSEFLSMVQQ